jgi:hypothetical protein
VAVFETLFGDFGRASNAIAGQARSGGVASESNPAHPTSHTNALDKPGVGGR